MNPETLRYVVEGMRRLVQADPDAAIAFMELTERTLARDVERNRAKKEGRRTRLVPVGLVQPTLADLGVNAVGCSGCARTYEDRTCPGCGNPGVVPRKKAKRRARR